MKKSKTKEPISNVALLQARVTRKYEDFKESMIELDSETVFELASTITAYHDVYSYITQKDFIIEDEAESLLKYENPLKMLADAWQDYRKYGNCTDDRDECMDYILSDITATDNSEEYMTVTLADELREKYGGDMPLNTAALLEIVELGRRFFNFNDDDFEYYDCDGEDDDCAEK